MHVAFVVLISRLPTNLLKWFFDVFFQSFLILFYGCRNIRCNQMDLYTTFVERNPSSTTTVNRGVPAKSQTRYDSDTLTLTTILLRHPKRSRTDEWIILTYKSYIILTLNQCGTFGIPSSWTKITNLLLMEFLIVWLCICVHTRDDT